MALSDIIDRIKTALGIDGSRGRQSGPRGEHSRDRGHGESTGHDYEREASGATTGSAGRAGGDDDAVDVTVEREPDTESEDAVKGTDTASGADPTSGESVTESIAADPEATSTTEDGTDESVDGIKGIGPTYADRLAGADVETVADLAASDAEDLAERADVPKGRLENWIERARHR